MTEQKHIKEIATILSQSGCVEACIDCECYGINLPKNVNCDQMRLATEIYNAGYHKQIAGEWVVISKRGLNSERNRRINYETYTCAVCGRSNGKHKANFCPNCGAKMKGDDGK